MKKCIALLLVAALAVCLFAGCGSGASSEETSASAEASLETALPTEAPTEAPSADYSGWSVALLTDGTAMSDPSCSQIVSEAGRTWCEARGVAFDLYEPTEQSTAALVALIDQAVADGHSALLLPAWTLLDAVKETAEQYPNVSFILLDVAAENMRRLSLTAELHQGDLLEGFLPGSFDLIVCNPPYIPTADCAVLQEEVLFEPRNALDGGADGLDLYRRLIESAAGVLVPGGALMMELGIHEADAVSALLSASGYKGIQVRKDLNGIERMILAYQPDGGKYDR